MVPQCLVVYNVLLFLCCPLVSLRLLVPLRPLFSLLSMGQARKPFVIFPPIKLGDKLSFREKIRTQMVLTADVKNTQVICVKTVIIAYFRRFSPKQEEKSVKNAEFAPP